MSSSRKRATGYLMPGPRQADDRRDEGKATGPAEEPAATPRNDARSDLHEAKGLGGLLGGPALNPALEERVILARMAALVQAHPERVGRFLAELARFVGENRPARADRTLNIREAAERIGVTTGRVHELFRMGRLGANVAGRPRFSELEFDAYRESERRPGRPTRGE